MPHPDIGAHWEGGHPDEGLLHEWLDEQLSDEAKRAGSIDRFLSELDSVTADSAAGK